MHQGPLIDHSSGKPYPMVTVGDFSLVDNIFPGPPGDSLLFNGEELTKLKRKGYQVSTFKEEKPYPSSPKKEKLKRKGYQVSTFKEEKPYPSSPKKEKQLSSHILGDVLSSSSKKGEPPKTSGKSPGASSPSAPPDSTSSKKSSSRHGKRSPRMKEWHDKESHTTSSKHKDKSHSDKSSKHSSDKETTKSSCKQRMSPPSQPSSTERAGKECHLEDTTQTSSADTHTAILRVPQSAQVRPKTSHPSLPPLAPPLPTRLGVGHASISVPLTAGAQ